MVEGLGATNRMGSREQLAHVQKKGSAIHGRMGNYSTNALYIVTTFQTQKDWATGLFYLKKGKIK
jgi:hypothetical protein